MKSRIKLNAAGHTHYLLLIILIGAVLRFYRLGYSSFGIDEVYTIYETTHGFVSPVHPPLSFAVLYPFMTIFGISELTARVPACLFGIGTIPLVYLLGKQIFGRGEGLIASFIVATSFWHIALSQEARMYTQLTFFVVAALYFFLEAVENGRLKTFLISTVFLVLAFYTHYTAILLLPVMFSHMLISRQLKKEFYRAGTCLAIFTVLSLPLILSFVGGFEFKTSESRWGLLDASSLFFVLYEFKLGISLSLVSSLGVVYILVKRNIRGYLLVLYAAIPLLVFSLLIFNANVQSRYLLFTFPAYALLASYVLMELHRNLKSKDKTLSLGFIVVILLSFQNWGLMYDYYSHYGYFHHVARPDWRGATSFVELNMDRDDLIASTVVAPKKYEYYPTPVEHYLKRPDFSLRSLYDFERAINAPDRVWLFIDDWAIKRVDPDHKVRDLLGKNCEIKQRVELVDVYLCEPSQSNPHQ